MGNQHHLSLVERQHALGAAYSSRRQSTGETNLQSERRRAADEEARALVTWRGRRLSLASGSQAARGTTWNIWALGSGTFVYATPLEALARPLAPRSPESVEVFADTPPLAAHVSVALLEVKQDHGFLQQGRPYLIARLREKAAELGCDAVFIKSTPDPAGDAEAGSYSGVIDADAQKLLARCIVYSPSA